MPSSNHRIVQVEDETFQLKIVNYDDNANIISVAPETSIITGPTAEGVRAILLAYMQAFGLPYLQETKSPTDQSLSWKEIPR